jgi:hypothetical protein
MARLAAGLITLWALANSNWVSRHLKKATRLAPAHSKNEEKQTPMKGHPVSGRR